MAKHNGNGCKRAVLEKRLQGPVEHIESMPEVGVVKVHGTVRYSTANQFMKVEPAMVGELQTGYHVTLRSNGIGTRLYVGPAQKSEKNLNPMQSLYLALVQYACRWNMR